MRPVLAFAILSFASAPALAQNQQPTPVPPISPFQALGNVIRNPDAPPLSQPQTVTSEPLRLPTAIPPNTVGQNPGR